MGKTIEIVTHCYRYSRALTYQLESLWRNYSDDSNRFRVTVFFSGKDADTLAAVAEYQGRMPSQVHLHIQPLELLYVRAIGRNVAALTTTADWIWFTDCDYLFGPKCLHQLAEIDPFDENDKTLLTIDRLVFPRFVQTCKTHAIGDRYLDRVVDAGLHAYEHLIDPADFYPRGMGKAIGGLQIVPGRVAREKGYCNSDRKRQRPLAAVTPETKFGEFHSDRAFRCQMGGCGTPIDLDDVYRLRHSRSFRDKGGADN